jgi:hypothetical protein
VKYKSEVAPDIRFPFKGDVPPLVIEVFIIKTEPVHTVSLTVDKDMVGIKFAIVTILY